MHHLTCCDCGAPFESAVPNAKFCVDCRGNSARHRRRYVPVDPKPHTCELCGSVFEAKGHPKFCPPCSRAVVSARRREAGARYRAKTKKPWKQTECMCVVCGSTFTAGRSDARYCSRECRLEAARRRDRERYLAGRGGVLKGLNAPRDRAPHNAPRQNVCESCGAEFTSGRKARWCPDCRLERNRASWVTPPRTCPTCGYVFPKYHRTCPTCNPASKRKRWKISDARRLAIYERDNWTCWLCGGPVDPGDDPRSGRWYPTLDHVIPRCDGGNHSDDNLRCAHRTCNSSRGSKAA